MHAGAKPGHSAPRERWSAAEQKWSITSGPSPACGVPDEAQALVRRQATLTHFGIVEIHLTQHLLQIATFVGEVLSYIHELSTSMSKAVRQQDFRATLHQQSRQMIRQAWVSPLPSLSKMNPTTADQCK